MIGARKMRICARVAGACVLVPGFALSSSFGQGVDTNQLQQLNDAVLGLSVGMHDFVFWFLGVGLGLWALIWGYGRLKKTVKAL